MAGQLTIDTLKATTGSLATQNGMTGIAKAWIRYNGTAGTITGSYNIASVTKNSTGNYTLNFSTAMANANYCVVMTLASAPPGTLWCPRVLTSGGEIAPFLQSTTQLQIFLAVGATMLDAQAIYVAILGD